jgi:hypothetical protein
MSIHSQNAFAKFVAGGNRKGSISTNVTVSKTTLTKDTQAQQKAAITKATAASDGWLTTKRRGRDDVAIAKDRSLALQARRLKNQRPKGNIRGNVSQTKRNGKSQRKTVQYSSDEDMGDFIVDDDYEDSDERLYATSSGGDDNNESNDGEDDDDDDDDDDFHENLKLSSHASRFRQSRKRSLSIGDDDSIQLEDYLPIPSWNRTPINLGSSGEDDSSFEKAISNKRSIKTSVQRNNSKESLKKKDKQKNRIEKSVKLLSSDDDLSATNILSKKPSAAIANGKNNSDKPWSLTNKGERVSQKRFEQFVAGSHSKNKAITGSDNHIRNKSVANHNNQRTENRGENKSNITKQKRLKKAFKSDSATVESDEDVWLSFKNSSNDVSQTVNVENKVQNFSKSSKFSNNPLLFTTDEDKTPIKSLVAVSRKIKIKSDIDDDDDDDMDEDEQMAIALALSESQKEYDVKHKKNTEIKNLDNLNKLPKSKNNSVFSKPLSVEFGEDEFPVEEENEEEDDISVEDVTVDERREAAFKVLATADKLSQQILQNMRAWSSECKGTETTQGIIVEGALAMHNFSTGMTTSDWISRLEMETICPNIKLADYQLIGVNWLALLHKMKADIGDGVKSNVNGILAGTST